MDTHLEVSHSGACKGAQPKVSSMWGGERQEEWGPQQISLALGSVRSLPECRLGEWSMAALLLYTCRTWTLLSRPQCYDVVNSQTARAHLRLTLGQYWSMKLAKWWQPTDNGNANDDDTTHFIISYYNFLTDSKSCGLLIIYYLSYAQNYTYL